MPAADAPPPGFYAPDPYAARAGCGSGSASSRSWPLWYVLRLVVDAAAPKVVVPPRVTPDRLTRLRADYTRQIDLVRRPGRRGRDHPAPRRTSS